MLWIWNLARARLVKYGSLQSPLRSLTPEAKCNTTSIVTWSRRCIREVSTTTRIVSTQTKSYSPASITSALAFPSGFADTAGLRHILIGEVQTFVDAEGEIYKSPDPWDPGSLLPTLEAIPSIETIQVDVNQLIFHSSESDENLRYRLDETPEAVLRQIGLSAHCIGLCQWNIDELPKTTIVEPLFRRMLALANPMDYKRFGWNQFVASCEDDNNENNAECKAFHYTMDFHLRDLLSNKDGRCHASQEELWGSGWHNYSPYGFMSSLSLRVLSGFMRNVRYFEKHPDMWQADLYEQIRENCGGVVTAELSSQESDTSYETADIIRTPNSIY